MALSRTLLGAAAALVGCTYATARPTPGAAAQPANAGQCSILQDPELDRGSTMPPLPLAPPMVEYPQELPQHKHAEDSAEVHFVVDHEGHVPACSVVVESISDSALLPFVPASVATLRFQPATSGGAVVTSRLTMPVYYRSPDRVRAAATSHVKVTMEQLPVLLPGAPPPAYPEQLRSQHLAGQVVIRATVTTEGWIDPKSVQVLRSDHPLFTAAVMAVLHDYRFQPARMGPDGPPIASVIRLPFAFEPP